MSLVEEYKLNLTVTLVTSDNNKADALTRVPRRWLNRYQAGPTLSPPLCAVAGEMTTEELVQRSTKEEQTATILLDLTRLSV